MHEQNGAETPASNLSFGRNWESPRRPRLDCRDAIEIPLAPKNLKTSRTWILGLLSAAALGAFAGSACAQASAAALAAQADAAAARDAVRDAGPKLADPAASQDDAAPAPRAEKDDASLTFRGVTLYGTFDIDVAYLNHGAPLTAFYGPGLPFLIQRNSNRPITSIAPNGLSQSKLGVSGVEPITDDVNLVFKLETGFQPTSFRLTNGPRSLVVNNGVPLTQQTTSGDSSRAGQLFQGAAYIGADSKSWGTLIFGRQASLILDSLAKYDPQNSSQTFSPIGYSGFAAGSGDTETARFDSALRYSYSNGPVHVAYLHNFKLNTLFPGGADQFDVGGEYKGFAADITYSYVSDAISEASLSAAQNAIHPGALAGTVSDDTAWVLEGKYTHGKAQFYAAVERVESANPSTPLPPGLRGLGGIVVGFANNTAFAIHRVTYVSWVGVRYALTDRLQVIGAYYRNDQNSFKGNGCSDTSASSCSGQLQDASIVADYRLTRRFDVYAGVNHSEAANGLASGFLETSVIAPVAGVRFNF